MKVNPITLILIIVFLYPLLKGFLFKFSSWDLKVNIQETNRNIAFITGLLSGIYFGKKIFVEHSSAVYLNIYNAIPVDARLYIENNTYFVYLILIPLFVLIIYKLASMLLETITRSLLYPLVDGTDKFLSSKTNTIKRISGTLVNFPKAICMLILVAFILNIASIFTTNAMLNKYLQSSEPYKAICKAIIIPVTNSSLAKKLPNIINDSFKVVVKQAKPAVNTQQGNNKSSSNGKTQKTIIYYNGVTLDQAVKSDSQIDTFSRNLTAKQNTTIKKAEVLYNWVGSNIAYDHNKANQVLNNDFNVTSGAIPTFDSRMGICFDYATLYVAACRANNIKVRLITGEGFNGVSWVSHAWNQVYIPEDGKWINVDTTFYKGGNYFNSLRFPLDHRGNQTAGEW